MLKVERNLGDSIAANEASDTLVMTYQQRSKGRLRLTSVNQQDVGLFLERGKILKHGDMLEAVDGQKFRVEAKVETLIKGECDNWPLFARCCYHLGNRHVAIQIGERELWIQADHILKEMLSQLGMVVSKCDEPFEPEQGAYSGGHHHAH